ncbi:hypothetical protein [Streptomyces sp. KLOTTS4A1]|uniref:hypothetical protein n=1 Tax=Streptomyces sp. KLOTTS4A1 TaxID=3390996 RepID=UPI0039F54694
MYGPAVTEAAIDATEADAMETDAMTAAFLGAFDNTDGRPADVDRNRRLMVPGDVISKTAHDRP